MFCIQVKLDGVDVREEVGGAKANLLKCDFMVQFALL